MCGDCVRNADKEILTKPRRKKQICGNEVKIAIPQLDDETGAVFGLLLLCVVSSCVEVWTEWSPKRGNYHEVMSGQLSYE